MKAFILILLVIIAVILWDRYRCAQPTETIPAGVAPAETSPADEEADPPKPKGWARLSDEQ